jgi:hypothetical protein
MDRPVTSGAPGPLAGTLARLYPRKQDALAVARAAGVHLQSSATDPLPSGAEALWEHIERVAAEQQRSPDLARVARERYGRDPTTFFPEGEEPERAAIFVPLIFGGFGLGVVLALTWVVMSVEPKDKAAPTAAPSRTALVSQPKGRAYLARRAPAEEWLRERRAFDTEHVPLPPLPALVGPWASSINAAPGAQGENPGAVWADEAAEPPLQAPQ